MRRIALFMLGQVLLSAEKGSAHEIMNLCMERGYVYRDLRFEGERIYFTASPLTAKRLLWDCAARGIEIVRIRERGLPHLLGRYRHRYGFFAGIAVAAAIIFLSGSVIWGIRIDGNEMLSDGEVIEELRRCGLSLGSRRRGLDVGSIENRVLISSDEISWISVNIIGTVAEVEIRESEIKEEGEEYLASNIVASRDGQIELFEDVRGNILLEIGDYVRKGELIVSGLYDSRTQGIVYTAARGRVLARTEREFSVEIPLKYEKKSYTGRVFTEKYIIFFEKEIKIFSNCRNLYPLYDKIYVEKCLRAPSGDRLPLSIKTVKYAEYEYVEAIRTDRELETLAHYKMNFMINSRYSSLLRKNSSFELTDDGYTLICDIKTVENIAKIQKIEVLPE